MQLRGYSTILHIFYSMFSNCTSVQALEMLVCRFFLPLDQARQADYLCIVSPKLETTVFKLYFLICMRRHEDGIILLIYLSTRKSQNVKNISMKWQTSLIQRGPLVTASTLFIYLSVHYHLPCAGMYMYWQPFVFSKAS